MKLRSLVMMGCLFVCLDVYAQKECTNDIDCNGDNVCGGKVCNWITPGSVQLCQDPVGRSTNANESWCSTDAHCKCQGLGAKCSSPPHCSFTRPQDAPALPDLAGADLTAPADLKPASDLTSSTQPDLTTASNADLTGAPVVDMSANNTDLAAPTTCDHDTECPGTTCGGQVCQWADSGHSCVAAGTDPQGSDGWCNNDDECKCKGEGATCNLTTLHCTRTLPKSADKKSGCTVADPLTTGALALLVMGAMLVARQLGRRTPARQRKG